MFKIHENTHCSVQEASGQLAKKKTYVKSGIKLDLYQVFSCLG